MAPDRAFAVAAALALLIAPGDARAQTSSDTAFSVERIMAPAGGMGLVSVEDARVGGHLVGHMHLLASAGHRPLVLTLREASAGGSSLEPVSFATSLQISASVDLFQKARFGLSLPFLLLDGQRLQGLDEERSLPVTAAGDLRINMTFNVFSGESLPLDAAFSTVLSLPTGDGDNFSGLDVPGLAMRVLLASRPVAWLAVMAQVGATFHDRREFFGTSWGQRFTWGAGLELGLPWIPLVGRHLSLMAESDGESCGSECPTEWPVELRGGVIVRKDRWQVSVSGGAGLTDAATVPAWRLTLGIGGLIGAPGK